MSGPPCLLSECHADAARLQAAAGSAGLAGHELEEALGLPQRLAQPLLVFWAARHLRLQQVAMELHLQDIMRPWGDALAEQLQASAEPAGADMLDRGFRHASLMQSAARHQVLLQAAVKLSL